MARYIDVDKAIPIAIQAVVDVVGHGISQVDAVRIAEKFEDAPTANVAPIADTVRKMQERLKANAYTESTITGYRYMVVDIADIDRIAKEILEGQNEQT